MAATKFNSTKIMCIIIIYLHLHGNLRFVCRTLLVVGGVWLVYDFIVNIGRGFSLQVFYTNAPIGFLKGYVLWLRGINLISVVSMVSDQYGQ